MSTNDSFTVDSNGVKLSMCGDHGGMAAVSRGDFVFALHIGDAIQHSDYYEIRLNDVWYRAVIATSPNAPHVNHYDPIDPDDESIALSLSDLLT